MVMSFAIAVIVIIIISSQWAILRDNKEPATTWLFFILLTIGTALAITLSLHIYLPSPLDFITFIFQPISNALHALLGI
ncbi:MULTISPECIES: hypothetical protein [Metasolibacillus]|uniref:hypothetical protein n=1 Tax=Metasolibacillus TaxID=2703677 RepID=UPI000D35B3AD|nr:hypothetical protein [Metasolibacillus fluoroglycofenilyticus]